MATIALYTGGVNGMPGLINDVRNSVKDLQSELFSLKKECVKINSDICNLEEVITSIQASTQTQEEKITSLEAFGQKVEQFVVETVRADLCVAVLIEQGKNDFYEQYGYLKPECEKGYLESWLDMGLGVALYCMEHWQAVAKTAVAVLTITGLGLAALFTGGILSVILAGAFVGALAGGVMGGITGGITNLLSGGDFLEGFADGILRGVITGGVTGAAFSGLGVLGALFGRGLACSRTLAEAVRTTAEVTRVLSYGMDGFDMLALGTGLFDSSNPLVKLNAELHSSVLYNVLQVGVNALAVFTGGASATMKCFVAGTMVLTASGLVAIETVRPGDKVTATDPVTLERSEKKVLETYVRETEELVRLTVGKETIRTTKEHPFYVKDFGFVNAEELYGGDRLYDVNGNELIVEDIAYETTTAPTKVYNFQVKDFHTYHVGSVCVLVHNAGVGYGGGSGIDFDLSNLSRSQQKAIESADNIINDHLKSSDLSAALGDLQGNPIAKPNGGYWNHAQEIKDAYTGLVRAEKALAGSLQNPNLTLGARAFIQGKYETISNYISIIEDMFASYGGIN